MYYNSRGVEGDIIKAIFWFEQAAEDDFLYALKTLGEILYYYGDGEESDYEKSFEYFLRWEALGNEWWCHLMKVYVLIRGEGTPQDTEKGCSILEKLSKNGM